MSVNSETFQTVTVGDGKARETLLDQLSRQLQQFGWPANDIFGMQMALEESVSNAYQHGNKNGQLGDVTIRWEVSSAQFSLEVNDNGCGFQECQIPNPIDPENLEEEGGRGLLLMRGFMDNVEYTDGGRKVVMRKARQADS